MSAQTQRRPPCDTCPCPAWGENMVCAAYQQAAAPVPEADEMAASLKRDGFGDDEIAVITARIRAEDAASTPCSTTPRALARRRLQGLGMSEAQAVAFLLPVIAETYREVADDATEGAHGGTWGETAPEALTAFAAAYRRMAADCDVPGAPLPGRSPALARAQAEVKRLGLMVDEYGQGAQQLSDKIARVRRMADSWEQQLPDTIRTETAVEAIRSALGEQP